jgi:hypothetical protein
MNNVLDMLLALIIVGMLILLGMQMEGNVKTHSYIIMKMNEANSDLVTLSDIVEYDVRKAGHGLIVPQKAITLADSNRIIFAYDRNPKTAYDSARIEYSTKTNSITQNPADLIVTRTENGKATEMGLGVTRFCFSYFNQAGTNLPRPVRSDSLAKIRVVQIDITVQSTTAIKGSYETAKYHSKITPKNMLIRYGR